MQDNQLSQTPRRGGARRGAGRKKGSGRYGEPTVTYRVPVSLVAEVNEFIRRKKRALPLYALENQRS